MGDQTGRVIPGPASGVALRPVAPRDLDTFFAFMTDPGAISMAAFTAKDPTDRVAFDAHWERLLVNKTVTMHAIIVHGEVAGNIGTYESELGHEVTYWVGRPFWGAGIATEALRQLVADDERRPMHARVVTDNRRSIRVLESNGFVTARTEEGFAHGRGEVVAEYIMQLRSAATV